MRCKNVRRIYFCPWLYTAAASQQDARMLPFSVESCGGMAPDAITLLHVITEAGQEHLGLWPRDQIVRQLLGSVAIAVQRGMRWLC